MTDKEKIEEAKRLYKTANADQKYLLESLFPELFVNEDERIKREIVRFINLHKNDAKKSDEWIAWLEKQGEKSTNKIEPKFKIGDWIIFNENPNSVYQIERIDNYRYYLRHYLGGTLSVHFDNKLIRPWTIQDAQNGDVLHLQQEGVEHIIIYRKFLKKNSHIFLSAYCTYNCFINDFYCGITSHSNITFERDEKDINPATKEQRDHLFAKMKEAGYEWDYEKKELGEIENIQVLSNSLNIGKNEWNPEDEKIRKALMWFVEHFPYDRLDNNGVSVKEALAWLEKQAPKPKWTEEDEQNLNAALSYIDDEYLRRWLKDAIYNKYEKSAWSEKDESKVKEIASFLDMAKVHYASTTAIDDCIEWLQSLK